MKFGLFSNGQRHNPIARDTYREDIEEIILADELGMDAVEQRSEGLEDVSRRRSSADVVGTDVDDDLARVVRFDEKFVVLEGFRRGGPPESAVDDSQVREIGRESSP